MGLQADCFETNVALKFVLPVVLLVCLNFKTVANETVILALITCVSGLV